MTINLLNTLDIGLPKFTVEAATEPDIFALSSHQRAHAALILGLDRPGSKYNIYVLGPDQAGRMTATREYVEKWAAKHAPADDWLYLIDFDAPAKPKPVAVPAGMGLVIRDAVEKLIPALARELASAFSSESYQQQITQLKAVGEREIQARSQALDAQAREKGMTLVQTPQGPIIAALNENGEPIPIQTLKTEQREHLLAEGTEIKSALAEINRDVLRFQQQLTASIDQLNKEVAQLATSALIENTAMQFKQIEVVRKWFDSFATDVVERHGLLLKPDQAVPTADAQRALHRYGINLLVDRHQDRHRPVIVEQNPTYNNVFGKIEYRQLPGGALETDVRSIQAGSLHRANGGVLILRATDIATQPKVWTHLKAALRDGEIRIEEFYRKESPPIAGAPQPVPVPLDLTVVLIGPPALYQLFFAADPDFSNYFKIKAHIEPVIDATPENLKHYAGLLVSYAKQRNVNLSKNAIQCLLGTAARWAGHRKRISTQFENICNIIEEACSDCDTIDDEEILKAIEARRYRNSHIEDEAHRAIRDKFTIISVTGSAVGQVNGLTVQNAGDHVFGAPARITARASIGRRGVINIERMVAMSGPIQQKGTLVLQGLLTRYFARHAPTSFNCSVTFEQTYGGVEGDSASLAEFIAIISDLADLPVRQDLAVTGSVNQLGEAQVIGGIHHKIEGFFRACQDAGALTGKQGVALPTVNAQHLVLREDVVAAVTKARFRIYTIDTVEDAIELFIGLPAGSPKEERDDTVYGRVVKTLNSFDRILAERGL